MTVFYNVGGMRVPNPVPASPGWVPLSDLPSRCTVDGAGAEFRVDPYWDGVWGDGSQAHWDSVDKLRRSIAAGLKGHRFAPKHTPDKAAAKLLGGQFRTDRLRALAGVGMWRTVTAEQLQCISGASGLTDPDNVAVRALFESGLVDVGSWASPLRRPTRTDWMFRPGRGSVRAFDKHVGSVLTWPEWVSVTAGQGWDVGGQYSRHNVLAVEFALRVAEFCAVGTVLGEKVGSIELLAGSGVGRTVNAADGRSADAVLVRPDGMRVAVEVTASVSSAFQAKVERWAQLLAASPMGASGLSVLFVVADPGVNEGLSTMVREQTHTAVRRAAARFPGVVGDRVAERMFVAEWRDWFPESRHATNEFVTLSCARPTGPAGDPWEHVDLLGADRVGFSPWDQAGMQEILLAAQGLAGVPVWLRRPERGRQLADVLADRAGWDGVPELPGGLGGRVRAKLPRRLRML